MKANKFLSFFSAVFLSMYCFNAALYAVCERIYPNVFGSAYRMFLYHYEHPYQYIMVFTLILALCAALFIRYFNRLRGFKKAAGIAVTLAVAFIASCAAGGALWKIHDMQAGFYTQGWRFVSDILWGMKTGVLLGWRIVLSSFPYNLIVLAGDLAVILIFYKPSRFPLWKESDHP
jgi:hypothetical protein